MSDYKSNYKKQVSCPICGRINTEEYDLIEIWGGMEIGEDYYNCDRCGYWSAMTYSPTYVGIELFHNPKKLALQIYVLIKNRKNCKNIKIRKCMM